MKQFLGWFIVITAQYIMLDKIFTPCKKAMELKLFVFAECLTYAEELNCVRKFDNWESAHIHSSKSSYNSLIHQLTPIN